MHNKWCKGPKQKLIMNAKLSHLKNHQNLNFITSVLNQPNKIKYLSVFPWTSWFVWQYFSVSIKYIDMWIYLIDFFYTFAIFWLQYLVLYTLVQFKSCTKYIKIYFVKTKYLFWIHEWVCEKILITFFFLYMSTE